MSAELQCDAILFDLDGVLVESRSVVERTWHRWSALRGLQVPNLVERAHGRRSIETIREVAPQLNSEEEVRWLAEAELADFEGVHALPGAAFTLSTLHDGEWAIVTSGGAELARRRLAHAQLPVPSVVVAAEDVSVGKPSPEGYRLAAGKLGLDPSRCVVVEDTPAGIEAGRLASARVIALLTTFQRVALTRADVVVHSLGDIAVSYSSSAFHLQVTIRVA